MLRRLLISALLLTALGGMSPQQRIIFELSHPGGASGGGGSGASEVQVLGTQIGVGLADTGTGQATNLLNASQAYFTGPEWQTQSVTGGVTTYGTQTPADSGVTDPLSGSTASTFTEGTGTTTHAIFTSITLTPSTTYTFSASFKQGVRTRVLVQATDVAGANGVFMACNLAGAAIGINDTAFGSGWTAGTTPTVVSQSNGFVLCGVTFTTPSSAALIQIGFAGDSGSGTGGLSNSYAGNTGSVSFSMWGANLNTGTSIVSYVAKNTNNGLAATALNNDTYTQANFWGTQTASSWVGVDAGSAVQWTRWRFAPQPGNISNDYDVFGLDYETLMQGATVQTNLSDSTFASGNVTVDTVPTTPFYPRYHLNERVLTGAASRYIRVNPSASNAFGGIGQLQFFAKAGSTYNARPVAPVISPWGGMVEANPVAVTMTSLTKQAKIYYTTDGSTPTASSTLYSGAVSFSPGSSSTIKALACWTALTTQCSAVVSAIFHNYDFAPRDDWYDNRGVLIEAHDGGVIWDAPTNLYYWVGVNLNQAEVPFLTAFPTVGVPRKDVGPNLYSSPTGRAPWTFVGNILPMVTGNSSGGKPWISLTRAHILPASACGGTYVLWGHISDFVTNGADRAAVATAPSITGPWTWQTIGLNPDSVGYKDSNTFYDGTGAYIVYTIGTQNGINISKLAANCLTTTSTVALSATQRESPVLLNGPSGGYFLLTSVSNTYNSAASVDPRYIFTNAANPLSGWGALPGTLAYASDPIGGNYNSQPTFALIPQGHTQYFVGGDYWSSTIANPLYTSRQVWTPVTFPTSSTMQIGIPATWNISGLN